MDPAIEKKIRDDNLRMHDAAGYADFYDQELSLIRNPWEQRRFRVDLAEIAARLPPGFRALDLGCGTGNLTLKLIGLGAAVTGVDLSHGMIARLRRKVAASPARPRLIVEDVDRYIAECGESFHLVCACSFLHHVPDYLSTLGSAARLVAPGGCLYVAHEPLTVAEADALGKVVEWLDFRWQRLEARTGIGGRTARDDPYYDRESLADYWAMNRGLDPGGIARVLRSAGLSPRITRYDSKRHRLMHLIAQWLGTRHLICIEAWRPTAPPKSR
jgi:SAM-dependent methyltransferase